MLLDLHVKNLALIENVHVEFDKGLNILTGETGAGKSIIIGSISIALGGKVPKDIIRHGEEYAYIELIFSVDDLEKKEKLEKMDVIVPEDGLLIISKKIFPSRSVSRINDETVTMSKLKQITSLLLDIHGQHEHQSLLYKSKHLEILDTYDKIHISPLKENISEIYHKYAALKERLKCSMLDQETRNREADFLRFEINEIEEADLKEDEAEQLEQQYRLFSNSRRILESLSLAKETVNNNEVGRAAREVSQITCYDQERLTNIEKQLYDLDALLGEVSHAITGYMDEMTFDENEFYHIEKRLDLIHNLQSKYGDNTKKIQKLLREKKERLEELEHFDELKERLEEELIKVEKELEEQSVQLSEARKKASVSLVKMIKDRLEDLNFLNVEFAMKFDRNDHYSCNGVDSAEFVISTNPGEQMRPLGMVASGGELSRIMLAIKTVLADSDDIPTLIFDEIDTGISGRTAQKVSEQLNYIAKTHQVICITHLPQIASMADTHFEIAKMVKDGSTITDIRKLKQDEIVEELARLLGGAQITDAVKQNAREMKELAEKTKNI